MVLLMKKEREKTHQSNKASECYCSYSTHTHRGFAFFQYAAIVFPSQVDLAVDCPSPEQKQHLGWTRAFAFAALPVILVLVLFFVLAKDSPRQGKPLAWKDYRSVLKEPDALWLCVLYSMTFGGFVGLMSFLTFFFHEQYHVSPVQAGDFTTLVVFSGSYLRPIGGWLADKFGGFRLLLAIFASIGVCLIGVGLLPALPVAVALLFAVMGLLGMGNGAVFQLVPLRFPTVSALSLDLSVQPVV